MRFIQYLLQEFLDPKKPDSVKSSTVNKAGVQGSVDKIRQRIFTTKKGNKVNVQFKPSLQGDNKSVDIVFYVNDTLYDNSSTDGKDVDNDFEILSGVIHIILEFVKHGKYDQVTFRAYSGNKDTKKYYNLSPNKLVSEIKQLATKFKDKLDSFEITKEMMDKEYNRLVTFSNKFNKPMKEVVIVYKNELNGILVYLNDFLGELNKIDNNSTTELENISVNLSRFSKTVNEWYSFKQLNDSLNKLRNILDSHREGGTLMTVNRRFKIYSRLVDKYFSKDWDISIWNDSFTLNRKTK